MTCSIIITLFTCLLLIVSILIKPKIKIKNFSFPIYPLMALLGSILMLIFTDLNFSDLRDGFLNNNSINPLKVLVLFISMTSMSIFLDETGFFEYITRSILAKNNKSTFQLFIILYVIISILTIFTSNDIIILTFTPFIIYFCKSAKINPIPFLIMEFVSANTYSMIFIIGNPTNIYLASSFNIGFLTYFKVMVIPTLITGLVSLLMMIIIFRKDLKAKITITNITKCNLKDKPLCIFSLVTLITCTIFLSISNFLHIEMYIICLVSLLCLIIISLLVCLVKHQKPETLKNVLFRIPYQLIPFMLGMFIVVLGLNKTGFTLEISKFFNSFNQIYSYGISSFLISNLVNNIPMSVLYASILNTHSISAGAIYASIIGSNLGALFTPIGALAGIMFSTMLKANNVKFTHLTFIKYGSVISLVSLLTSLVCLFLVL